MPEGGVGSLTRCPPLLTEKHGAFVWHIEMFDERQQTLKDSFDFLKGRGMPEGFEALSQKALLLQKQDGLLPFYRHMVYLYTTSYIYRRLNYAIRANNNDLEKLAGIIFYMR